MHRMKKWMRTILIVVGFTLIVVVLLVSVLIGYLAVESNQIVTLPQPTGAFHVGRSVYDWTDTTRTNAFAGKPQEQRALMVMVWYPTDTASGPTAPYLPQPWLDAAETAQSGLGELVTHKLTNVHTNSYVDAPLASAQKAYPVVILEPGLGKASYDYTSIAEDVASHGYVVISSTPTYLADMVVFQNGQTKLGSSVAQEPDSGSSLAPATLAQDEMLRDVYVGDITYLLTQVDHLNTATGSAWAGRFDTARIGIMGHSLGGEASYHICLFDTRCKVALNMDGALFGEMQSVNRVPFMYLSSDTSNDTSADEKQVDAYNLAILDKQLSPFYQVSVRGSEHFNFSDLAVRSPLFRYLGALGAIDGRTGLVIIRQYVVGMLDKYLTGAEPAYLSPNNALPGSTVLQR
jgi:dienelactone hydrolase